MSAFELAQICSKFMFTISVTRSTKTSPAEQAELVLDGLRELRVSKNAISLVQRELNELLVAEEGVTVRDDPEQHVDVDEEESVDGVSAGNSAERPFVFAVNDNDHATMVQEMDVSMSVGLQMDSHKYRMESYAD